MTKDRDYYRALSARALLDEVKYGVNVDWHELAVALAVRLEDAVDGYEELERESRRYD